MNYKKWIAGLSLVLAALMLCACAKAPQQETSVPTTQPVASTNPPTIPTYEEVENTITYFSLSMGENYRDVLQMNVFCNDGGTVHVEYVGEVKKVGDFDANILHGITAAFRESGLEALIGQDIYDEGEANGSMYIEFTDGSVAAVGFSGTVSGGAVVTGTVVSTVDAVVATVGSGSAAQPARHSRSISAAKRFLFTSG